MESTYNFQVMDAESDNKPGFIVKRILKAYDQEYIFRNKCVFNVSGANRETVGYNLSICTDDF